MTQWLLNHVLFKHYTELILDTPFLTYFQIKPSNLKQTSPHQQRPATHDGGAQIKPFALLLLKINTFGGTFVATVIITTLLSGWLFVCCTLLAFFSGAFPHLAPGCLLPCASSRCSSAWRPRRRCSNRYLSFSFSARRHSNSGETSTISMLSRPRLSPSRRLEISFVRRRIWSSWADRRASRHSAIFKRPP